MKNSILIGKDDCYLRLERDTSADPYAPFRVEARLRLEGRAEFFALSTLIVLPSGESERRAFVEFSELRSNRVILQMSDDGLLELRRDVRGHIDVLFSIGCRRAGPFWKTSGDIHVDGEYTQDFLRNFGTLVFGPR
jgi:hypothetical protein